MSDDHRNPSTTQTEPRSHADVYRRRWAILGVLCTSLIIIVIGNTSLNVALPTMSEALGLTNSQQQWVVDAYSLIFAGHALHRRHARRPLRPQGLHAGRHRAVRRGFARTPRSSPTRRRCLIAARAVMGIGGALVMPATLSILVNSLPVAASGPGPSASGPASPVAAAHSASCSAAGSSRTSGGARRSPSTCRSTVIALVARRSSRADSARIATRPSSTLSARRCRWPVSAVRLRPDRSAALGLDLDQQPRRDRRRTRRARPSSCCGSCTTDVADARRPPVQEPPLRRLEPSA